MGVEMSRDKPISGLFEYMMMTVKVLAALEVIFDHVSPLDGRTSELRQASSELCLCSHSFISAEDAVTAPRKSFISNSREDTLISPALLCRHDISLRTNGWTYPQRLINSSEVRFAPHLPLDVHKQGYETFFKDTVVHLV